MHAIGTRVRFIGDPKSVPQYALVAPHEGVIVGYWGDPMEGPVGNGLENFVTDVTKADTFVPYPYYVRGITRGDEELQDYSLPVFSEEELEVIDT